MIKVSARENESFDNLLQRFKRAVKKSNVLVELKNKEYFLKKSLKRLVFMNLLIARAMLKTS